MDHRRTSHQHRSSRLRPVRRRPARLLALAALVVALVPVSQVGAQADPGAAPASPPARFLGVEVGHGARASMHVGKAEISRARRQSAQVREQGLSPADVRDQKRAVVQAARAGGGASLSEDDVDVFQLNRNVTVAAPARVEVDSVDIALVGEEVTVTSTSSARDKNGIAAGGPGMAPYWAKNGDGQYKLTVKEDSSGRTLGTATFLWKREKLASDGSSRYDWYMYARKAVAQPSSIAFDYDPRVKLLRVQSYPFDATEPGTLNWTDIDPASNFTGDCSGNTYVEIETPIVSAGYNFRDCDSYKVWHNPDNPGSYWIEMNQGSYISHSGSMEAAYSIGWKSKNGAPAAMHDVNKVTFFWHGDAHTCTTTDTGTTCSN